VKLPQICSQVNSYTELKVDRLILYVKFIKGENMAKETTEFGAAKDQLAERIRLYLKNKQVKFSLGVATIWRTDKVFFITQGKKTFGILFTEQANFDGLFPLTAKADTLNWVWAIYGGNNLPIARAIAEDMANEFGVTIECILASKDVVNFNPRKEMDISH
jgi:hypothetical protein